MNPNTSITHAGETNRLTDIQLVKSPRCNFCHFHVGQAVTAKEVTLTAVPLLDGKAVLICQFCAEICKQTGDTDYSKASRSMRPLPPECQAQNDAALKLILMAQAARQSVESASAVHDELAPRKAAFTGNAGKVTLTDADGNVLVIEAGKVSKI